MSTRFGQVSCIKAFRAHGLNPVLDFVRVAENSKHGVQTSLLIDANVVIDIAHACGPCMPADDETLKRFRLFELVEFLKGCHQLGLTYYVSPFFGLMEVPHEKVKAYRSAIDAFAQKFGLSWVNAEPIIEPDLSVVGRFATTDRFMSLDEADRKTLALPYSALLLMLVVARDSADRPPFIRFKRYLKHYQRRIDLVSMRAIAIARFIFAPQPERESDLYEIWEDIVLNFTQRDKVTQRFPATLHQMDKAALNGAYDIRLLDAALVVEARKAEGRDVDPWIVTLDRKLHSLTEVIHHTGTNRREAGQYAAIEKLAHHGEYWARTDRELEQLALKFRGDVDISFDRIVQRAIGTLSLAAHGLA